MSRDWTKKELKAVSKAMKEEGYMSFGEFCKKGKFIYPEETQIENTANAANTTNTAAEVAPMKHLTFTAHIVMILQLLKRQLTSIEKLTMNAYMEFRQSELDNISTARKPGWTGRLILQLVPLLNLDTSSM